MFLNSEFVNNNASHPIGEFLQFLKTNDNAAPYESELAKKVVSAVNEVRNDADKEGTYMTYAMKLEEVRKAALKEGREEGLNERLAKGRKEGLAKGQLERV